MDHPPSKENTTALIAFSTTMLGLILLSLPLVYLYEKGEDWYKKRGKRGDRRTLPASSSASSTSLMVNDTDTNTTLSTPLDSVEGINNGNKNFELLVINRCIQCDPCDLYHDKEQPTVKYANNNTYKTEGVTKITELKASGRLYLTESSSQLDTSASETLKNHNKAAAGENYYAKKRLHKHESGMLTSSIEEETDDGTTQTSNYDFDVSRDCIIIYDDESPQNEKVLIGEPARFKPAKSSNKLVSSSTHARDINKLESSRQVQKTEKVPSTRTLSPKPGAIVEQEIPRISKKEERTERPPIISAVATERTEIPSTSREERLERPMRYQPIASNNRIICSGRFHLDGCDCCTKNTKPKTKCKTNDKTNSKNDFDSDSDSTISKGSKAKFW